MVMEFVFRISTKSPGKTGNSFQIWVGTLLVGLQITSTFSKFLCVIFKVIVHILRILFSTYVILYSFLVITGCLVCIVPTTTPASCSVWQRACDEDGQCLNSTLWCDGVPHCRNGSDERNCGQSLLTTIISRRNNSIVSFS